MNYQQGLVKFIRSGLLIVAMGAPASFAFAKDSPLIQELQNRIQKLEEESQGMKADLEKNHPAAKADGSAAAFTGIKYKGLNLKLGGFLASETVYRSKNNESDISTTFNKIPFNNVVASDTTEFRGSQRTSRLSLLTQSDISADTHLAGYWELDFMGSSPTANPNQSNSFTPRTRHIYFTMDWDEPGFHILAGQTWSLVTLNSKGITPRNEVPPQTIETSYVVGFDYARQWEFRMTKDWDKKYWLALSLENSQTVGMAGTLNAGTTNTNTIPAGSPFNPGNMSINNYPDIVTKFAAETDFGHYEIYDLLRNFQSRFGPSATQTTKQSTWANAVGAGAIIPVIPKVLDLTLSGLVGKGVGRYGTTMLSDATYGEDGSLVPLNGQHTLAQLAWHVSNEWEVYGAYGQESVNPAVGSTGAFGYGDGIVASNAGCSTLGGTCTPQLKSANQSTLGFWWSFYKGDYGLVKFGAQVSHTNLETFTDSAGLAPKTSQEMFYTSLRYFPF